MAIRPIDMQVLIPRSTEILKQDAAASTRAGADQQFFASVLQKNDELNATRVLRNENVEQNNVDKDGRSGNSGTGTRKNKNNAQSKGKKNAKEPNPYGSIYDFSV